MTLETYIKNLQDLVKKNPKLKKVEVVYSSDSEGNNYEPVHFSPTPGVYNKDVYWTPFHDCKDPKDPTINAVCIN